MKKKEMEVRIAMLEGALLDLIAYVALQGTEDEMRMDQLNVWRDRFQTVGRCSDDLTETDYEFDQKEKTGKKR